MIVIDIILYHGSLLKNVNANKGLPFEGLGIKCYYTQIDCRLKTPWWIEGDSYERIVCKSWCAQHTNYLSYATWSPEALD